MTAASAALAVLLLAWVHYAARPRDNRPCRHWRRRAAQIRIARLPRVDVSRIEVK